MRRSHDLQCSETTTPSFQLLRSSYWHTRAALSHLCMYTYVHTTYLHTGPVIRRIFPPGSVQIWGAFVNLVGLSILTWAKHLWLFGFILLSLGFALACASMWPTLAFMVSPKSLGIAIGLIHAIMDSSKYSRHLHTYDHSLLSCHSTTLALKCESDDPSFSAYIFRISYHTWPTQWSWSSTHLLGVFWMKARPTKIQSCPSFLV